MKPIADPTYGEGRVGGSSAVTVTVQLGEKRKYKKIIQTIA